MAEETKKSRGQSTANSMPGKKTQTKRAVEKRTAEGKKPAVKSVVMDGANPDVKFYRISDELPTYLL